MTELFVRLRERPFRDKLIGMLLYGALTFAGIYAVGAVLFNDLLIFRVVEFLWFVHIVIICNQIQRSRRELLLLSLAALAPGIINNILVIFAL
jgi:hypothetical protein